MALYQTRCFMWDMEAAQKAYEEIQRIWPDKFAPWEHLSTDFHERWHAEYKAILRGES